MYQKKGITFVWFAVATAGRLCYYLYVKNRQLYNFGKRAGPEWNESEKGPLKARSWQKN